MDDLMVNVKVPRSFTYDLFDGTLSCYSSDFSVVRCVLCPFLGSVRCIAVKLKQSSLCVEETEDCTAVAGAIKSSLSPSDTPPSGEFEWSES